MAEYIEREALMCVIEKSRIDNPHRDLNVKRIHDHEHRHFLGLVENRPTADVAEVRHGEWLPDYETFVDDSERESEPIQTGWVCSLCGRQEFQKEPYCHCGAKMDGKGD